MAVPDWHTRCHHIECECRVGKWKRSPLKAQCNRCIGISCWCLVYCSVSCHVSMNCWKDTHASFNVLFLSSHYQLQLKQFTVLPSWTWAAFSIKGNIVYVFACVDLGRIRAVESLFCPAPSVLWWKCLNGAPVIEWHLLVRGLLRKYCCIQRRQYSTCMPIRLIPSSYMHSATNMCFLSPTLSIVSIAAYPLQVRTNMPITTSIHTLTTLENRP